MHAVGAGVGGGMDAQKVNMRDVFFYILFECFECFLHYQFQILEAPPLLWVMTGLVNSEFQEMCIYFLPHCENLSELNLKI